MSWRESAACNPNNWPTLERKYGEKVREQWWMPNTPDAGLALLEKGAAACEDCPSIAECEALELSQDTPSYGVWAGSVGVTGSVDWRKRLADA